MKIKSVGVRSLHSYRVRMYFDNCSHWFLFSTIDFNLKFIFYILLKSSETLVTAHSNTGFTIHLYEYKNIS
jgi:hypothetical protein